MRFQFQGVSRTPSCIGLFAALLTDKEFWMSDRLAARDSLESAHCLFLAAVGCSLFGIYMYVKQGSSTQISAKESRSNVANKLTAQPPTAYFLPGTAQ